MIEFGEKFRYLLSEGHFAYKPFKLADLIDGFKLHQGQFRLILPEIRESQQVVSISVPRFLDQDGFREADGVGVLPLLHKVGNGCHLLRRHNGTDDEKGNETDTHTEDNNEDDYAHVRSTVGVPVSVMTMRAYGVSRIVSNTRICVMVLALVVGALLAPTQAPAQAGTSPLLRRGEELFMQNRPEEAAPVLEAALEAEPTNERIFLYLGIVYEQLGRPERAAEILRRGAEIGGQYRGVIFFNLANNYAAMGQTEQAEQMYTQAIRADSSLSAAYLNRANLRVRTSEFQRAIDDYTIFLTLAPTAPQRPQVEQMMSLLRDTMEREQVRRAEEERVARQEAERRRVAEEIEREAERRRAEEEARRQAEEEARRRALLDSVLDSLGGTRGETRALGGGTEDIRDFEDSFDIVD